MHPERRVPLFVQRKRRVRSRCRTHDVSWNRTVAFGNLHTENPGKFLSHCPRRCASCPRPTFTPKRSDPTVLLQQAASQSVVSTQQGDKHGHSPLDPVVRRHPSRDRRRSLRVNGRSVGRRARAPRLASRVQGVRANLELCRRRPTVAVVRVLPAEQAGRTPGRPRRGDDAEPAGVPGHAAGHHARRRGAGECESVVHAARTRAPAQ